MHGWHKILDIGCKMWLCTKICRPQDIQPTQAFLNITVCLGTVPYARCHILEYSETNCMSSMKYNIWLWKVWQVSMWFQSLLWHQHHKATFIVNRVWLSFNSASLPCMVWHSVTFFNLYHLNLRCWWIKAPRYYKKDWIQCLLEWVSISCTGIYLCWCYSQSEKASPIHWQVDICQNSLLLNLCNKSKTLSKTPQFHHGSIQCYSSTWWELRSVNSDPRW